MNDAESVEAIQNIDELKDQLVDQLSDKQMLIDLISQGYLDEKVIEQSIDKLNLSDIDYLKKVLNDFSNHVKTQVLANTQEPPINAAEVEIALLPSRLHLCQKKMLVRHDANSGPIARSLVDGEEPPSSDEE